LFREVTKNPMVTPIELQSSSVERKYNHFQKVNHFCSTPPIKLEWPDRRHSSVKGMTVRLEFAKRHLKESDYEKQDYLV
jgi:hypothetical protein